MRRFALLATTAFALAACAPMGAARPTGTAQQEANRQAVLAFYEKGLNQKDADAALQYVGTRYVQHNPTAPDGPAPRCSTSPSDSVRRWS